MTAPERLRRELEHQRERGRSFRQAWPVAVNAAVRGLDTTEEIVWRQAWREQRSVWQANYGGPNVRPRLFVPEPEAIQMPRRAELVA
jgi:hypothetical protein